jgi:hypothetical protein
VYFIAYLYCTGFGLFIIIGNKLGKQNKTNKTKRGKKKEEKTA